MGLLRRIAGTSGLGEAVGLVGVGVAGRCWCKDGGDDFVDAGPFEKS
jgi:hypothetical protein